VEIVTARLRLRPIAEADAARLLVFFRDDHVRRYLLDGGLVDEAWVRNEIAASRERFAAGGLGLHVAMLTAPGSGGIVGRIAGVAGFRPDHDPPVLELVFAFLPEHKGQGLATEAGRALVEHFFATGAGDVLHAAADVPNIHSIRVLEKLGFREARRSPGAFGDMVHYELRRV
jgi:[ribosomal protein S5]-alanine N-acetyltransferase